MRSSTLGSETVPSRGETSQTMEDSEERMSVEASFHVLGEIDEENQDKDLSMMPLLSPHTSLINYPETSRARDPEMEQEEHDDSRELRHLRAASSYMASVADVVLRALAVILTLIALVLTATKWKGHWERSHNELSFMNFFLSGYMLSVNVVVFLYSCAILSLKIFQSVNGDTRSSNNLLFLLSIFQLDQTFAYLLISATLNAFDSSGNLTGSNPATKIGFFYERTLACALVSLLAVSALATTFLSSGPGKTSRAWLTLFFLPAALGTPISSFEAPTVNTPGEKSACTESILKKL